MQTLKLTKKYEHYPEYKDSGVEWFGDIPKNWEVTPLRSVLIERKEKNTKLVTDNILSVMKNVGVIRYADKGDVGNKSSDRPENYKIVHAGDIVLNSMNLVIGSVGRSKELGVTSSVYIIYYPRNTKISGAYFHYLFRDKSWQKTLGRLGKGIMELRESIKANDLKIEPVPIPQPEEQAKIAYYLDEKTALIDQIIEKKQKLIELLREKRTAVINHAVTKGLDPQAELVESGIDWIGKIPKSWNVRKLKFIAKIDTSGTFGAESEFPSSVQAMLITTSQISIDGEWKLDKAEQKFFPRNEYVQFSAREGDILVVKSSGSASNIASGKAGYITKDEEGAVFGNFLLRITPQKEKVTSRYLHFFLMSNLTKQRIELSVSTTTYPNLKIDEYVSATVLIPGMEEMQKITSYLESSILTTNTSIQKIEQAVELLQEFKSSLISHVVTGKVKV